MPKKINNERGKKIQISLSSSRRVLQNVTLCLGNMTLQQTVKTVENAVSKIPPAYPCTCPGVHSRACAFVRGSVLLSFCLLFLPSSNGLGKFSLPYFRSFVISYWRIRSSEAAPRAVGSVGCSGSRTHTHRSEESGKLRLHRGR